MSTPEIDLACAVIGDAISSYRKDPVFNLDDFLFLTGRTEIARFWFEAAGLNPFSDAIVLDVFGGVA